MQPVLGRIGKRKRIMAQTILTVNTSGAGLYEITAPIVRFVAEHDVAQGLLTIYVRHTSCSLLVQENADPDVQADLDAFFARLVPPADAAEMSYLRHRSEGTDDMPAHIKAALTQTSIGIPVAKSRPLLGQWQGIFVFEHRARPHQREVVLHLN
jgi:secondary thiamine-phosphate synthase enzyme